MDDLSEMLVLANLGDLDQDVLGRVIDAHVAGPGHVVSRRRSPAATPPEEAVAVGNEVIVIPDEGDENEAVTEDGIPGNEEVILRPEEGPGFINDQMWEQLLAEYCQNVDSGNQFEGLELAGGDRGMEEHGEGAMEVAITDEEWENLIAEYCGEAERGMEAEGGVGREEREGVGRPEGSAPRE